MHERDEPLSSAERDALRDLSAPVDPGPELEDRVVETLASRQAIRRGSASGWLRIAVAVALVATGFAVGRVTGDSDGRSVSSPTFMLLLYEDEGFDSSDRHAPEYARWAADLTGQGRHITGAELAPTAFTLPEDAGPAASGSLAGYFLLGADDLDEAIQVARTSPHLRYGGRITIRPLR